MRRLASWLAPVAWTAAILWFSGESWSAAETGSLLGPVLRWVLPWATPAQVAALHAVIRKLGHLTEYGLLAWLWWRAFLGGGATPRRAAAIALGLSVAVAVLDEAHQATSPNRTGSAVDVGIDAGGAVIALGLLRADRRRLADRLTAWLLWVTLVGGGVALVVNALAGVHSIALWISTLAAAAWLAWRWYAGRRPRAARPKKQGKPLA